MANSDEELDNFSISESMVCNVDDCSGFISHGIPNMKILTQNIRSISRNFDELIVFLCRLKLDCDVLILTECWLSCNLTIPNLPGYKSYTSQNYKNQNDGIILYVKESLNVDIIEPPFLESNCLILTINNDITIIAMYRSPSYNNLTTFLASLNSILTDVKNTKSTAIIGDINIDISMQSHDTKAPEYLNMTAFHGFLPAHTFPTRQGKTCLDHVLLKTKQKSHTFVLNSTITDHNAVLLCLYHTHKKFHPQSYASKLNVAATCEQLKHTDFSYITGIDDPNQAMDSFVRLLQNVITENTTIVKIPRKKRIIRPWITPGLLRCIRNRDRLHKESQASPDNETSKLTYTRYRNHCNALLKRLKTQHDRNELDKNSNNNKKLWEVIKTITYTNKTKSVATDLLGDSPQASVIRANDYFTSVGSNLANKLINCPTVTQNPIHPPVSNHTRGNSFVLLGTDEHEIISHINGLKCSSAVGHDKISNSFLKAVKDIIVQPLTQLFNRCLGRGVFPDVLKKAIIVPIFKAGDRRRVCNYRPIAVLPAISKILERIINCRLVKYLESNSLISSCQFGFRSGKSTEDAVHKLTDHVMRNLDDGNKALAIFLDLAKAFDTVSAPRLLAKLERLGIRGLELKLFQDYLSGRRQCLRVDSYTSTDLPVTFGVPQGSVLGPTLFLVYLNDLCDLKLENGTIISYADDTALLFSADTWENTFSLAQNGFDKVSEWLKQNILTLNTEKTMYMPFYLRNPNKPPTELTLKSHSVHVHPKTAGTCDCPSLIRRGEVKYLGVILDSSLNYKAHISLLQSRLRKLIYVFKNLRRVADKQTLNKVYKALCQSLLTYCISCWGGAPKTTLLPLEIAQRAILKVSSFRPIFFPTHVLYRSWNLPTVRQLYILTTILKQHSLTPVDRNILLKRRRNAVIPQSRQFKHSFTHRFFCFSGPFLYNKLNATLNIYTLSKHECKTKVLDFLLACDYNTTEELLKILR